MRHVPYFCLVGLALLVVGFVAGAELGAKEQAKRDQSSLVEAFKRECGWLP